MRAVLYAYCEVSADHAANLAYFVAHGMQCPDTQYVFILNGPCSQTLPVANPLCIILHRENTGFDFAGWAAGLAALRPTDYTHFVFLNASCRGPVLPCYCPEPKWVSLFTSKLQGAVHCVGPTINIYKTKPQCQPHVQTYAWAVTQAGLAALIAAGIFAGPAKASKVEVIEAFEIGVSKVMLANQWELGCFVREYDAITTYQPHNEAQLRAFNPSADVNWGDIACPMALCYGRTLPPAELMFVKTTRGTHHLLDQVAAAVPTLRWQYGTSMLRNEVTRVVETLISRGDSKVLVCNAVFGDPHVGVKKDMWLIHEGRLITRVAEHTLMQLQPLEPMPAFRSYAPLLERMTGLEVGGPSPDLMQLGVYTAPDRVDSANFAEDTLWSSAAAAAEYTFPGKTCPGTQFIVDAVALTSRLPAASYDFVVTCHVLEHLVNPLKALRQMAAVTKPGGYALHILPWKTGTFDHRRPITPFAELVQHFDEDRDERDVSDHMDEVRAFYDLGRDPSAGTWPQFLERCSRHADNRALHVHVFDFALLDQCLAHAGFRTVDRQLVAPMHQVVLARKLKDAA